jgi:inner membrane protein
VRTTLGQRSSRASESSEQMSILGHVAIGVATARLTTRAGQPSKTIRTRMVVLAALALLPDIDLVLQEIAPSVSMLQHRAATHSLAFAIGVGGTIALVVLARSGRRAAAWGFVAGAVVASHGLLDSLGDSNLGVALLWPFSNARLLAPWHVLPNPSLPGLLSTRGLAEVAIEFVLFLPFWLYAFLPRSSVPEPEG